MKVAIIDSGVHAAHPHIGGVTGGIGIHPDGSTHDDYVDRLGHGTAVAAVIHEKAPQAELFIIKVFDRELAATGAGLVSACRQALHIGANIVNLSLGTQNQEHAPALLDAVTALRWGGAIVVAAGEQDGVRWLPGTLEGVWSVTLDWSLDRNEIRQAIDQSGHVTFRASGYPRPIPGVPLDKNLKGLSFAVANVTGVLARGRT